jgi:hypothetical protein
MSVKPYCNIIYGLCLYYQLIIYLPTAVSTVEIKSVIVGYNQLVTIFIKIFQNRVVPCIPILNDVAIGV